MTLRLSPRAETDLREIWDYIAQESGSPDIADRQIAAITERFFILAEHPHMGRVRDEDLGPGRRSLAVNRRYIIVYTTDGDDVFVLRAVHGRRDLRALMQDGEPQGGP